MRPRFGLYRDIVPGRQIAIGQSERPGFALHGFEKDVVPGIKHRLIDDHGGVGRYPNIITGVHIAIDQGEGRFGLYRDIVPGRQIAIGQSERPGVALHGFEKDVIPGIKHRLIDDHGGVGRYPDIITGVQIAIDQGEGRFGLYRDIVPGRQIAIGQSERPAVALHGF